MDLKIKDPLKDLPGAQKDRPADKKLQRTFKTRRRRRRKLKHKNQRRKRQRTRITTSKLQHHTMQELEAAIMAEEVEGAIKSLPKWKTPGLSGLTSEELQNTPDQ